MRSAGILEPGSGRDIGQHELGGFPACLLQAVWIDQPNPGYEEDVGSGFPCQPRVDLERLGIGRQILTRRELGGIQKNRDHHGSVRTGCLANQGKVSFVQGPHRGDKHGFFLAGSNEDVFVVNNLHGEEDNRERRNNQCRMKTDAVLWIDALECGRFGW